MISRRLCLGNAAGLRLDPLVQFGEFSVIGFEIGGKNSSVFGVGFAEFFGDDGNGFARQAHIQPDVRVVRAVVMAMVVIVPVVVVSRVIIVVAMVMSLMVVVLTMAVIFMLTVIVSLVFVMPVITVVVAMMVSVAAFGDFSNGLDIGAVGGLKEMLVGFEFVGEVFGEKDVSALFGDLNLEGGGIAVGVKD